MLTQQVDQNSIKYGMGMTFTLLAIAFVLDSWLLVGAVVVAQLVGALNVPFAPYRLLYRHVVVPNGWIKPNFQPDHMEPHQFAQLVGGLFNILAIIALLNNLQILGWGLVGIVFVLSNLNVWISFCMGCWMYYQLNRLGVPGFSQART